MENSALKLRESKSERNFEFKLGKSRSVPRILKPNSLLDPTTIIGKTTTNDFFFEETVDPDYNFISEKNQFSKTSTNKKDFARNLVSEKTNKTSKNFRISKRKRNNTSKKKKIENVLENFFERSEQNFNSLTPLKINLMSDRQKEMYKTVGYNFWMDRASKKVDKKYNQRQDIIKALENDMYDFKWKKERMTTEIQISERQLETEVTRDYDNPYALDMKISKKDDKILKNLFKDREEEIEKMKNPKERKVSKHAFKKEKEERENGYFEFIDKSEKFQIPKGIISQYSHINEFYITNDYERSFPGFYKRNSNEFIRGSGMDSKDISGIIKSRKLYLLELDEVRKSQFLEIKSKNAKEALLYAKKSVKPKQKRRRRMNWKRAEKKAKIIGKINTNLMIKDTKHVPRHLTDIYSPKRVQLLRPYKSYWMRCVDKLLNQENTFDVEEVGYYSIVLQRMTKSEFISEDYELLTQNQIEIAEMVYNGIDKVEFDLKTERIHEVCRNLKKRKEAEKSSSKKKESFVKEES